MSITRARPPSLREFSSSDADGNHIHNEILLSLPQDEREILFPKLEFVRLGQHQVLHESNDTLKSGHFCDTGMVSIMSTFSDGESVEVGLVGKEGFIGLPLVAGFQTSQFREIVQFEATAFRIDAATFRTVLAECPTLAQKIQQFAQVSAMEAMQIAACNQLHDVQERFARWLLMCADRIGSCDLPLTQELLSQMLGTRRSSVTVAAGILQKLGLIGLKRGTISILNRPMLEQQACECYRTMQQQKQRWQSENVHVIRLW
jgi:CRP-like cAMP-binding protein